MKLPIILWLKLGSLLDKLKIFAQKFAFFLKNGGEKSLKIVIFALSDQEKIPQSSGIGFSKDYNIFSLFQ